MTSMGLAAFLLALVATCRITRFVTKDTLAAGFRIRVADRFGDDSKVTYLVNCGWCLSIWVGTAMAVATHFLGGSAWLQVPETALTLSYVAGVAARWLD